MVKKKSCVFISGAGTNLRALIRSSREYNYPININLVISDNKNALGLKIAKKYNIDYKIFNLKKNNQLEIALRVLKKKKISLICLAGYMKILSKKFIKRFNKRIINIHPSLLPKYKGLDTFKKVLINKPVFFLSSPRTPCNQCPVYKKQKSSLMLSSNPEFCGFLL